MGSHEHRFASRDRARWQRVNATSNACPSYLGPTIAAVSCLAGFCAVFLVMLAAIVLGAIGALPGAVVILAVSRVLCPQSKLRFGQAYGAAFLSLVTYGGVVTVTNYLFDGDKSMQAVVEILTAGPQLLHVILDNPVMLAPFLILFLLSQVPGWLSFGYALGKQVGRPFTGIGGFALACGIGVVCVVLAYVFPFTVALAVTL